MRRLIAAILLGGALWQAAVDWQATIGQGYAYRLTPIGQVLAKAAPQAYERLVGAWKASPLLWDPVGATLMALPLALTLAALAALLWLTRRR